MIQEEKEYPHDVFTNWTYHKEIFLLFRLSQSFFIQHIKMMAVLSHWKDPGLPSTLELNTLHQ